MTLVFGYGSNMDNGQMDLRCPKRETVGVAVLRNHRLCFPRRSDNRGCGVSSVVPAEGHEVWGVVHRLNTDDLDSLDRSEGYRAGRPTSRNSYNRVSVVVEMGEVHVEVQTYIANPSENPPPPNAIYLTHIRDGARQHGLPDAYQTFLASLQL